MSQNYEDDDAPPEPAEIEYFLYNHDERRWEGPWQTLGALLRYMHDAGLYLSCRSQCPVAPHCTIYNAFAGAWLWFRGNPCECCTCELPDLGDADVYVDRQRAGAEWGVKERLPVRRFPRAYRRALVRHNDAETFLWY